MGSLTLPDFVLFEHTTPFIAFVRPAIALLPWAAVLRVRCFPEISEENGLACPLAGLHSRVLGRAGIGPAFSALHFMSPRRVDRCVCLTERFIFLFSTTRVC